MSDGPTDSGDSGHGTHVLTDPTVLTTQQLRHELRGVERELSQRQDTREREQFTLRELIDTRMDGIDALNKERHIAQRREDEIREAHRLELKTDNERTVTTAMIAAEKAVQAALAAAEKARDQQTIASQLATTKAEQGSKEQMAQQGETFTLAISGLTTAVNDMKGMIGELRAEKRGGQEQVTDRRAGNTQIIATVAVVASLFGGALIAVLAKVFGG